MTFSIWESEDGGITLKEGDGPLLFRDGTPVDPRAKRVKVFTAASWAEACQVQHDHYGWGAGRPK